MVAALPLALLGNKHERAKKEYTRKSAGAHISHVCTISNHLLDDIEFLDKSWAGRDEGVIAGDLAMKIARSAGVIE
jgi:hypothetical protein